MMIMELTKAKSNSVSDLNELNAANPNGGMLISVVMPAFNAGKTIEQSIQSVINQSYSNWELIIINDASQDDTLAIINQYIEKNSQIILVNLKQNGGLPNARNAGIKMAKGSFIAFLDSDDTWAPYKLETQVDFHLQHPDIKISHTGFEYFNDLGVIKRPLKKIVNLNYKVEGNLLPSIYYKNTVGVLTVMVERNLLIATGAFDDSLWTMEDQDLWIRIAKRNERFGYIDQSLANYRLSAGGMTHKIGKYKNAYRTFIAKYKTETIENRSYNLVLANYYRYFGIVYAKDNAYKLSLLYLTKAMKVNRFVLDKLLISVFILKVKLKSFVNKNN